MIVTRAIFGLYVSHKLQNISPERLDTELFIARADCHFFIVGTAVSPHFLNVRYDFRPGLYLNRRYVIFCPKSRYWHSQLLAYLKVAEENVNQSSHGQVFRTGFSRPNLSYVVRQGEDKLQQLLRILNRVPGSAIVYENRGRKRVAEELCSRYIGRFFSLRRLNLKGKNDKQQKWKADETVMVRRAFRMGIDKPNARLSSIEMPNAEEYFVKRGTSGGRRWNPTYAYGFMPEYKATAQKARSITSDKESRH